LLLDLAEAGYRAYGLDRSPAMLGLARRRLGRQGHPIRLCRAEAAALPFASHAFEAVAVTFPTAFVYDPAWIAELTRVLRPGGRAIVVEMATFEQRDPYSRSLEWLYRVTGQRGPAPDLCQRLAAAGLVARRQEVPVQGTRVSLVLAYRPQNDSD
jgi:ubiquinone/menaquinone biosynthesis C-methylase UbiE